MQDAKKPSQTRNALLNDCSTRNDVRSDSVVSALVRNKTTLTFL